MRQQPPIALSAEGKKKKPNLHFFGWVLAPGIIPTMRSSLRIFAISLFASPISKGFIFGLFFDFFVILFSVMIYVIFLLLF